jgi:hypothetical protein
MASWLASRSHASWSTSSRKQSGHAERPARLRASADGQASASPRSLTPLPPFPGRPAFLNECSNSLPGVGMRHIADHQLPRIFVGVGHRHLKLAIKRLLAERRWNQRDHEAADCTISVERVSTKPGCRHHHICGPDRFSSRSARKTLP